MIDGLLLPDDAYLSLTVARSIGRGLGPLYGSSYTNGFQPLWVFLMAPLYAWHPSDLDGNVHAALVALAACDAFLAAIVCALVWRWTRNPFASLVVAAAWAVNPYSVRTSLCGLEASLSAALAAFVLLLLDRERIARAPDRRRLLVLGIAIGFAILARIDNGILALTVAVFLVPWRTKPWSRALRDGLARIFSVAAPATAVTLPWLIYSSLYTGELYRSAVGRCRSARSRTVSSGRRESRRLSRIASPRCRELPLLRQRLSPRFDRRLLLVIILFARSDLMELGPALSRAAPALLWSAILFIVYPLHVLASWHFSRYQYPILVTLLLALGLLFDFVARRRFERLAAVLATTVVAGTLAFHATRHETSRLLLGPREVVQGYRAIGVWA